METRIEIDQLISKMTNGEKAMLLQHIVQNLGGAFKGIDETPGVCGGDPCIVRTRIPVWLLVQARKLGTSEAEILRCYPSLRAEDIVNAFAYYSAYSSKIDKQIHDNEE